MSSEPPDLTQREPLPIDKYPPNIVATATLFFNTFNRVNQIMHGSTPRTMTDEASLRAIRVLCRDLCNGTGYHDLLSLLMLIRKAIERGSVTSPPFIDATDPQKPTYITLHELITLELAKHGR